MSIWRRLAGIYTVQITSADIPGLLAKLSISGIALLEITQIDPLTVHVLIARRDYPYASKICVSDGSEIAAIRKTGLLLSIAKLARRPVILAATLMMIASSLLLPDRILFIQVQGNHSVTDNQILACAKDNGLYGFAPRKEIRSEAIKNNLLSSLPQLQWVGVTTKGCVATVSVKEKDQTEESESRPMQVSSIVATRDGVIVSATVLRGNGVCQVGQAVREGDILISGYTDCGICIQATSAAGQVLAQTNHSIQTVAMDSTVHRGDLVGQKTKYSLRIGKKLINFYKDSGISDTTCVRIYTEECVSLPGGFRLPIALIREQWQYYMPAAVMDTAGEDYTWMKEHMRTYLQTQMTSGQIVADALTVQAGEGFCTAYGVFSCIEEIGQSINEERMSTNG